MSKLTFTDGVSFDTAGQLRIERRRDGLYVVGEGTLCPIRTRQEGVELIDSMQKRRAGR